MRINRYGYIINLCYENLAEWGGENKIRFIDLFAGIGGFHLALHNLGAECVFASEWDKHARETYEHNFRRNPLNCSKTEISSVTSRKLQKRNSQLRGSSSRFHVSLSVKLDSRKDLRIPEVRFFDIAEIIKIKQPKAYFLESVGHVYKHDEGRTFSE